MRRNQWLASVGINGWNGSESPAGLRRNTHHGAYLGQVQTHRLGVAVGHDQCSTLAVLRADGAEDVGRGVSLVPRRRRPGAAPRPAPGDLVLLAYSGLVGEPDLQRIEADTLVPRDACQRGAELFLKVVMAPSAWA